MQVQVELTLVGFHHVLKLLTDILLVTHHGFQLAAADEERVLRHGLVVIHLLVWHHRGIRPGAVIHSLAGLTVFHHRHDEFAGRLVALPLHDARVNLVIREVEMGVTPVLVQTQHAGGGIFLEAGVEHPSVVFVLVVVRQLLAVTAVPHESVVVTADIKAEILQTVVRVVFGGQASCHMPFFHTRSVVHHHHAGHGVGAIDKAGWTFQNLNRMHVVGVNFHTMLVAPLLAFLTNAVVHDGHAVVTQSANHWLGDAAAGGDLRDARLFGDGVDDVGGGGGSQLL